MEKETYDRKAAGNRIREKRRQLGITMKEAAEKLGLPLCFTTAPKGLTEALADKVENLHPVEVYVHSPWE